MKGWIQWVGGSVLFALLVISYSTCNDFKHNYEEQSELIVAMQDSIKYLKNKDGEQVAQIALLEGSKEHLLSVIGKSDARLAKLLKQGAKSGTAFNQTARIDTVLVTKIDTIDNRVEYSSSLNSEWVTLEVRGRDDSLQTKIELRDRITVSFKDVRQGFLKPKKSVVEVTNANPYVKVDGLRSFDIPSKKSNAKMWIGVGLGFGAGYLLFK